MIFNVLLPRSDSYKNSKRKSLKTSNFLRWYMCPAGQEKAELLSIKFIFPKQMVILEDEIHKRGMESCQKT